MLFCLFFWGDALKYIPFLKICYVNDNSQLVAVKNYQKMLRCVIPPFWRCRRCFAERTSEVDIDDFALWVSERYLTDDDDDLGCQTLLEKKACWLNEVTEMGNRRGDLCCRVQKNSGRCRCVVERNTTLPCDYLRTTFEHDFGCKALTKKDALFHVQGNLFDCDPVFWKVRLKGNLQLFPQNIENRKACSFYVHKNRDINTLVR